MAEHLPSAHAILWFLATFVSLWGWSLAWRGVAQDGPGRWWRRLRWRLVGPGLAVQALAAAAGFGGAWAYAMSKTGEADLRFALPGASPWTAAGFGVLAFAAVVMVVGYRGDRARGRERCRRCWYDMSATAAGAGGSRTCPECGKAARTGRDLSRPRRRWRVVGAGLVIAAASYGVMVMPKVRTYGWVGALPTAVMIAGIAWLPDAAILDGAGATREDGSLLFRYRAEVMWKWQQSLVHGWARRTAASDSASLDRLGRALVFLEYPDDRDVGMRMTDRFLAALVSDSQADRTRAAYALYSSPIPWHAGGSPALPPAAAMIQRLGDSDRLVVECCIANLGRCGSDAEPAVDRLIGMLPGASRNRMMNVALALQNIAKVSPPARATLVAAMGTAAEPVNRGLGVALGSPDSMDAATVSALRGMIASPNDAASYGAGMALVRGRIADAEFVDALMREAASTRANRDAYVYLAGRVSDAAPLAIPRVVPLLSDPSPLVRRAAASVIADWAAAGADVSAARAALEALAESDDEAAATARDALSYIRPGSP